MLGYDDDVLPHIYYYTVRRLWGCARCRQARSCLWRRWYVPGKLTVTFPSPEGSPLAPERTRRPRAAILYLPWLYCSSSGRARRVEVSAAICFCVLSLAFGVGSHKEGCCRQVCGPAPRTYCRTSSCRVPWWICNGIKDSRNSKIHLIGVLERPGCVDKSL